MRPSPQSLMTFPHPTSNGRSGGDRDRDVELKALERRVMGAASEAVGMDKGGNYTRSHAYLSSLVFPC